MDSTNKQTFLDFVKARNEEDWVLLESYLHDDYSNQFLTMVVDLSNVEHLMVNPYFEFLKLVGFDEDIVNRSTQLMKYSNTKKGEVEELKFDRLYFGDWEITNIMAEGIQVWATVLTTVKDPKKLNLKLSYYFHLEIIDKKIRSFLSVGRYLYTLMRYGRLVIERNEELEIKRYIESLTKLGLLPNRVN